MQRFQFPLDNIIVTNNSNILLVSIIMHAAPKILIMNTNSKRTIYTYISIYVIYICTFHLGICIALKWQERYMPVWNQLYMENKITIIELPILGAKLLPCVLKQVSRSKAMAERKINLRGYDVNSFFWIMNIKWI